MDDGSWPGVEDGSAGVAGAGAHEGEEAVEGVADAFGGAAWSAAAGGGVGESALAAEGEGEKYGEEGGAAGPDEGSPGLVAVFQCQAGEPGPGA